MIRGGANVFKRKAKQRLCRALIVFVGCVLGAADPAAAHAGTPIHSFSIEPSTSQAGGHPDITTEYTVGYGGVQHLEDAKGVLIRSPAGVIANPHATPTCTAAVFGENRCPVDSQVGLVEHLTLSLAFEWLPVYNLEPHTGEAGLLGFTVPLAGTPIFIAVNARTESDYGLDLEVVNINHLYALTQFEMTLWGVPASPTHDYQRIPVEWECNIGNDECPTTPQPSNSPEVPFLDNPTSCGVPLSSSMLLEAYNEATTEAEDTYPETTGCQLLSFNPSLSALPTTNATDAASGLEVDLSVPQLLSPTVPSGSEIRETTVTLPPGFSLNPSAAAGKVACTNAEAEIGTRNEAHCPEYSKIGSVMLDSTALPTPVGGSVYIGAPTAAAPYRVIAVANGYNTHVKLIGVLKLDPITGQITTVFADLPQSPYTAFDLHYFGSEEGVLATPSHCGTYAVESTFTPWDSALPGQNATQFFTLDTGPHGSGCPSTILPFDPTFAAASANSASGAHSPFSVELTRNDGDQNFSAINVTTPPGLLATLAGIPYCSESNLAAITAAGHTGYQEMENPSCPAASEVGTATTAAGAGTNPVYLSGKVYLAGPYHGAPLSLAVVIPAVSGPYDLGNVMVRVALHIDPETAAITATSDPLPQILEGIPPRVRLIRIDLNRPNFTINPTNCQQQWVNSDVFGDQGSEIALRYPFQVANCRNLGFAPKLSMGFAGATKRAGNPAVRATLNFAGSGPEANVSRVAVTLPPTELVDNAHIQDPCTKVQFYRGHSLGEDCPQSSQIGYARAETSLLEKPLEGPVYLRTGGGYKLPDIVAALNGQIDIALDAHVDEVHQRIRTTFADVPDATVRNFTLMLDGGKKGLLENTLNLCPRSLHAAAYLSAQNNMAVHERPLLTSVCNRRKHTAGAK